MSNIFTLIQDAEPTQDEILKSELFWQQFLEAKFPDVDFRQGTGIRDMVIRPGALLLATVNKGIDKYFSEMSVKDITDNTTEETADKIMSNFFIERKKGTSTIIKARLYFAFPGNIPANVQIPGTAFFSPDNEKKYYPLRSISLNAPSDVKIDGVIYLQFDSAEELWYADVDLQAEKANLDYDIDTGDLIYFTIFNPYFIKGEVLYLSTNAIEKETNTQMITRSYSAISTRNLINDPSIVSRLNDVFNFIKNVKVVGFGDVDMYRDIITVDNPLNTAEKVTFSVGGKVDTYCYVDPVTRIKQYTTDADGDIYIDGAVFSVARSAISGNANGDADLVPANQTYTVTMVDCTDYVDYNPVNPLLDVGLSARQRIKIHFGFDFANKTASFVVRHFGGLLDIQKFMDNTQNRVVCGDYLVRSFEPVLVKLNIKTHNTPPLDITEFETEMKQYIDSIPEGGDIYLSTIYGILNQTGITDAVAPIDVKCTHVDKGMTATVTQLTDAYKLRNTSRFIYDGITIAKA